MKSGFSLLHRGDHGGLKDIALMQHAFIAVALLATVGRGWFPAALVPMMVAAVLALIIAVAADALGDCLHQERED